MTGNTQKVRHFRTQRAKDVMKDIQKSGVPAIITVYDSPADYPGKFVARLFAGKYPTDFIAVADTLQKIREAKPLDMLILPDPGTPVEVWL